MDKMRVDGANGVSFSSRRVKGGFTPSGNESPYTTNSIINSTSESFLQLFKSGINPNKAVFTIDSKTSQILIVNYNACQLLGYTSKELCSMEFSSLLINKNKTHVSALAEGQLNSEDGTMILLSGKVVEVNTKTGAKIPVSLWIRQIDTEGRCLAVAEPVERKIAEFTINQNGYITNCDHDTLTLFQYESIENLNGLHITVLIPAIKLPEYEQKITKSIRKQKATGKTQDGVSFPLCLIVKQLETSQQIPLNESQVIKPDINYTITIWVFTNLSGLIVIDDKGLIESCNHHFSILMFGYSESKILGQFITKIIPNFAQDYQYIGFRSRNATISSLDNDDDDNSLTETDPIYTNKNTDASSSVDLGSEHTKLLTEPIKVSLDFSTSTTASSIISDDLKLSKSLPDTINGIQLDINSTENNQNIANCINKSSDVELLTPVNESYVPSYSTTSTLNSEEQPLDIRLKKITITPNTPSTDFNNFTSDTTTSTTTSTTSNKYNKRNKNLLISSTPTQQQNFNKKYRDGNYRGESIHSDGNIIDIIYTVSSQTLPCGRTVYCIWISRDPEQNSNDDQNYQNFTLTFNSITSTFENSLGQAIKYTAAQNSSSRPNSLSLLSQCEEDQNIGEYGEKYTTLKQIGKGAYGFVKMAYRKIDRLLVIVKFILKEKLCSQFMVLTEDNKEVPMEIYLLTTINHPNIVTVHDVFENEKFVQLIMEKHGSGMDLFEFIDRRPLMDEILACYIFRQIANAVDYLHTKHILHRDIKDENIIIDQNFNVKLIDFGSATFMQEGKLFSTFFGTTEYCSPEVLSGNKYAGPELEMWSLGVTLYVIIFFENPFLDIEETLHSELTMPHSVSTSLEMLLQSMLNKNPVNRCTLKQLIENNWLTQEIDGSKFNFNTIVRCEPYEINPDIYFNDQKYSSTTALSTASPNDTLSLVDDDDGDDESIIDLEPIVYDEREHPEINYLMSNDGS